MKKSYINYKGTDYPVIEIELSKISNENSNEIVIIADYELFKDIEEDYENNNQEAINIDNMIYFYCDSGFIASNKTEKEIIKYMKQYT